jgi:hypothetical protein
MSEWMPLLLAIVGSAPILGGIGWWFQTRRADRIADKLADLTEIKSLREQIYKMQQERIQYEITRRESAEQTNKVLDELRKMLGERQRGTPS